MSALVRVELPASLCVLASLPREVRIAVDGPVTYRTLLDALEAAHPSLRGCIRDQATHQRRPYIRFFACEEDLSHLNPDDPLPTAVPEGSAAFLIIGAISGG